MVKSNVNLYYQDHDTVVIQVPSGKISNFKKGVMYFYRKALTQSGRYSGALILALCCMVGDTGT